MHETWLYTVKQSTDALRYARRYVEPVKLGGVELCCVGPRSDFRVPCTADGCAVFSCVRTLCTACRCTAWLTVWWAAGYTGLLQPRTPEGREGLQRSLVTVFFGTVSYNGKKWRAKKTVRWPGKTPMMVVPGDWPTMAAVSGVVEVMMADMDRCSRSWRVDTFQVKCGSVHCTSTSAVLSAGNVIDRLRCDGSAKPVLYDRPSTRRTVDRYCWLTGWSAADAAQVDLRT